MRANNQLYTGEEYQFRFGVYLQNMRFVQQHNADKTQLYTVSMNHLATLTPAEYKAMLGFKPSLRNIDNYRNAKKIVRRSNADSLDWREKGVVNEVKNQYFCGSCWAFSAIQAAESANAISTGTLLSLSEQNLVDCVDTCEGCNGGLMDLSYDYIIAKQGGKFNTEAQYWYVSFQESCYFEKYDKVGSITGYVNVLSGDEDDLAAKIETYGPAAVAIDASAIGFQLYMGGIYDNSGCSSEELDHGVGCVGYGVDGETKYWIVRNSWGAMWGESGYVRMIWLNNQCGIATESCIPLP